MLSVRPCGKYSMNENELLKKERTQYSSISPNEALFQRLEHLWRTRNELTPEELERKRKRKRRRNAYQKLYRARKRKEVADGQRKEESREERQENAEAYSVLRSHHHGKT